MAELAEQLQTLSSQHASDKDHAGDIPTRTVEARNEAVPDRIGRGKNNWNRRACSLGRQRGRRAAGEYRGDVITDQIGRKGWQAVILTFRITIYDPDVLAFDKTAL